MKDNRGNLHVEPKVIDEILNDCFLFVLGKDRCKPNITIEKLLKDRINGRIERQELIRDSQHGFTNGRFSLTNPNEFLEEVRVFLRTGYMLFMWTSVRPVTRIHKGDWSKR